MLVAAGLAMAAVGVATPALAQKKGDSKAADKGKEEGAKKQSAWVKLCEKVSFPKKSADGKEPAKEEKNICLTHHERLDGNTGLVLVSAAIRDVEGQDKKSLMIMVPLGMAIPPGVRAAVYTPEQWEKASKNEKIDDKALKPIELRYTLCHQAGCTAEVEATPEFLDTMKKGGGLMVLALNAGAQPIGFPVPLAGFTAALDGPPVDNAEYAKARAELMQQIRKRQAEAVEKMKAEQKAKAEAAQLLDPPPGSEKKADKKKSDKK